MAIIMGLGLLFHILLGFRYILVLRAELHTHPQPESLRLQILPALGPQVLSELHWALKSINSTYLHKPLKSEVRDADVCLSQRLSMNLARHFSGRDGKDEHCHYP